MILLTYMFSDESGPHEYSTFLFSGKPELLGLVREAREERKRQEEIFVPTMYSFLDLMLWHYQVFTHLVMFPSQVDEGGAEAGVQGVA